MFELDDQVILITGAAGLLGRRFVRALLNAGARVGALDIDGVGLRELAESLPADRLLARQVDIRNSKQVGAMVEATVRRFGRIDGLVNSAALDPKFDPAHAGEHALDFEALPLEQWQAALDVNLTGAFLCAQAVAPHMLRERAGSIVNISSIYGLVGPDQSLYSSGGENPTRGTKPVTYSVTKAGLLGLTRYLAAYWRGRGIRVNTLTLGGVYNGHADEFVWRYSARTLVGRMAAPDEYCGALIFMLSPASAYMTGANLVIDGGWTAW